MSSENYVTLTPGVPKRLHFLGVGSALVDRVDPITKSMTRVKSLRFAVDREDGNPVSKVFGTLSSKLQMELEPYLAGERYKYYEFTLIKDGAGFVAPRILLVSPL